MLEPSWCSHSPTCECLSFPPNYYILQSMFDYSINLFNESPPRSSTVTPILIDQPEPTVATPTNLTCSAIPPPILPQSAVSILAQDIPTERARDIAKGLITTLQHRNTI